jgi:hypothetical protein
VWQNVEVVKTKMEYRELYRKEKELIQGNDLLRYEIEKMRTFDQVSDFAKENDLVSITPDRFTVLVVDEKKDETKKDR